MRVEKGCSYNLWIIQNWERGGIARISQSIALDSIQMLIGEKCKVLHLVKRNRRIDTSWVIPCLVVIAFMTRISESW